MTKIRLSKTRNGFSYIGANGKLSHIYPQAHHYATEVLKLADSSRLISASLPTQSGKTNLIEAISVLNHNKNRNRPSLFYSTLPWKENWLQNRMDLQTAPIVLHNKFK